MASIGVEDNRKQFDRQASNTARAFTQRDVIISLNNMLIKRVQSGLNKAQMRSEGSRGKHGKWRALSPAYAARKAKTHPGKPILRKTDRLFRSSTSNSESGGTGGKVGNSYLFRYQINVPYAKFHQDPRFSPTRRVFDPNEKQERGIAAAIARTISEAVLRTGLFVKKKIIITTSSASFDSSTLDF